MDAEEIITSTMKNKTPLQPRTMAELMPCLKAIMTKDAVQSLSCKKKPRTTVVQTYTSEKKFKPMNIEELRGNLTALKPPASRFPQPATSGRKKPWNSSIKVDKTKSRTADGQMKHSTVRKTLKFQQKPLTSTRATMAAPIPKKSLYVPVNTGLGNRISGVWKMSETPRVNGLAPRVPNTTKAENISFKSNSDASFLQREKEINDFEEKTNALTEEPTLERIAEVSPPVSTPFNDYRNVREYFNNTCNDDNLTMDNTIMCFDKTPSIKENNNREESVIVSLCEMLTKATVMNSDDNNTELDNILALEKQTENHLKMIDNVISILNNMKEKQLKSLKHIKKLKEEINGKCKIEENVTSVQAECTLSINVKQENVCIEDNPIKRPTVIKTKSPSYKVPRKSICLRKKVFCKSMPNVSDGLTTPTKSDKALNMYLQIKEHMTFLNTPLKKGSYIPTPDTPAITSHNLKKQLDKLYNES